MDKKNKGFKQKDHIVLPKATLKRFANPETKKIKYLDLSDPENISIIEKFPHSFHTEPDYYIPEYDDIIKRYETKIGKYFRLITDNHENNLDSKIDRQELKKDILDIINIQFNRSIISSDEYLGKLLNQFKKQYDKESLKDYCQEIPYLVELQKIRQKFELYRKNPKSFRRYAQNIFNQKNPKIIDQYRKFIPYILIIPDNISSTFILPPQHFVPVAQTVRIILSPRIALSLYPENNYNKLIKYLTKEEVDFLAPRTIETALLMPNSFKQIIGEENYLNCIKNKLQIYKSILYNLVDDIILVESCEVVINDSLTFLELAVSILLFKSNCHKIIIELSAISNQFLQEREFTESIQMFGRWELALVFINNNNSKNPNIKIKIAQNKEDAINMF